MAKHHQNKHSNEEKDHLYRYTSFFSEHSRNKKRKHKRKLESYSQCSSSSDSEFSDHCSRSGQKIRNIRESLKLKGEKSSEYSHSRHKKRKNNRKHNSPSSSTDAEFSDHHDVSEEKIRKVQEKAQLKREKSSEYSQSRHKKKKDNRKHKSYQHSPSSPSSSDSEFSDQHELSTEKMKNAQERLQLKEEKRRQKDLMKQVETPELKRLRRLAKKEAKERKRKEQMGWDEEYMGYTNTDNPFGDANLLKTFVWNKKLEKEGLKSLKQEEIERRNKLKLDENRMELEKVKQRRLERERERESREDELTRIQREKEAAQFKEWEKQEDGFHLQQAKLRSKIRIQDGRAKPIDLLARYISAEEEDLTVEMHEPYVYLNGLNMQDLEDLQEDIKVYMELENGKNLDYWRDLQIIVEDELHKLRRADCTSSDHVGDRREGINAAVSADVVSVFKGKTPNQLQALYKHINHKIHCGEEGIDIGYWETLLSRLKAYMARARLRERHQENLQRKLFQLKQEQGVESGPLFPCVSSLPSTSSQEILNSTIVEAKKMRGTEIKLEPVETVQEPESPDDSQALPEEPNPIKQSEDEYLANGYSPRLLTVDELEPGTFLIDAEEDSKRLEFVRQQFAGTGKVEDALTKEEKAFEREARKGMDGEEAIFSVEAPVEKTYLWSDKYRPRKPRYFNRVHTGFEWNKYNQTHYDMDNPPPKIVQGYKFNIFYPDLITKSKTPEYTLTTCDGNKDFSILRFHAGPPYEDIAFKIVNREWEYSYKRGFRCQFHNNIFQLWFHFKRYRYRR